MKPWNTGRLAERRKTDKEEEKEKEGWKGKSWNPGVWVRSLSTLQSMKHHFLVTFLTITPPGSTNHRYSNNALYRGRMKHTKMWTHLPYLCNFCETLVFCITSFNLKHLVVSYYTVSIFFLFGLWKFSVFHLKITF